MVAEGQFRGDLYYRINVIELAIPALRTRAEDIPMLTDHFLKRLGSSGNMPELTDTAYLKLKGHAFPGNVRELENILERALALTEGNVVDVDDIDLPESTEMERLAPGTEFYPGAEPLEAYLERIERKALADALDQCNHNKTGAAKLLGLTFRAFRYKLAKFGL
jgi:two-component system response regulator PilR (NtrC family)